MKIKQIIQNAAEILGLSDVVELMHDGVSTAKLKKNANYRVLVRCANLVVSNLAANYDEMVVSQVISANVQRRIEVTALDHHVVSVKEVLNSQGRPVIFSVSAGYIFVPTAGNHTVIFSSIPRIATGEEFMPFGFSPAVIEYGILSEYSFSIGAFNEGKVWHEKMVSLLFDSKNTGESVIMPRSF